VTQIAPAIVDALPGARARIAAIVAGALVPLPGATADDACAWLAEPVRALFELPAAAVVVARSPELEASLAEHADVAAARALAADLTARGDPRGTLIGLQLAEQHAEAELYLERHRRHFFGELAAYATRLDGIRAPAFTWARGFIATARLGFDARSAAVLGPGHGRSLERAIDVLLTHPSGALLRELVLTLNCDPHTESSLAPAIEALARHGAPALRKLRLGEVDHGWPRSPDDAVQYRMGWVKLGPLDALWPRLARLTDLTLQGNLEEAVLGAPALPALRSLTVMTGGLAADNARAIAEASWPRLETMELWFGEPRPEAAGGVAELERLLSGRSTPALHTLRLMNATFTDELVDQLARSPLLPRLRELSLALGTLTDAGAAALARQARAFAHLEVLDLECNCLSEAGCEAVAGVAPDVWLADQKDPRTELGASVFE
jgi:hypothetical protein